MIKHSRLSLLGLTQSFPRPVFDANKQNMFPDERDKDLLDLLVYLSETKPT